MSSDDELSVVLGALVLAPAAVGVPWCGGDNHTVDVEAWRAELAQQCCARGGLAEAPVDLRTPV